MSGQPLTRESDAQDATKQAGPIRSGESDLADRLRELIGDESHSSFARRCGVGETTLRKYLDGADPSTKRLIAMAEAGRCTVEWLATGRGPKKHGAPVASQPADLGDLSRLTATIAAVEEGLRQIHRKLPPDKYAEVVAAAYQLMTSQSSTAQIVQFIRVAA